MSTVSSHPRLPSPEEAAQEVAGLSRALAARGWLPGTGGNLSAVVHRDPLRLVVTRSGVDKGALGRDGLVEVDGDGRAVHGDARPSDEVLLHLAVARAREEAGAVVHTHSVWGTLASCRHAAAGGVTLAGYEMLKALEGVRTHVHGEWVPILANSQDMHALSRVVERLLRDDNRPHGFLLEGHGLYTWGADLTAAKRHVEALEFLFEVTERS